MKPRDLAALFALAALWGGSFLFIRIAVPSLGPFPLVAGRVLLAALVYWIGFRALGQRPELRAHGRALIVLGGINAALPFALMAGAGLYLTASLSAMLNATVPIWAALFGALWLGERLTVRRSLGLVLGVIGVGVLVGWSPLDATLGVVLSIAGMLVATCAYALSGVYTKLRLSGVPAPTLALGQQLGAAVWLVAPALWQLPDARPTQSALLALGGLAVLSTSVAYLLYFHLIATVGPTKTTTVTYLIPLFGTVWGAIFLDEPVTAGMLAGLGLILGSVILVNQVRVPGIAQLLRRRAAGTSIAIVAAGALGAACTPPAYDPGSPASASSVLYAASGPTIRWYDVDIGAATLTLRDSISLPANVHFAVQHPDKRVLYAGWTDVGSGTRGTMHGVSAFTISSRDGGLAKFGPDAMLPSRPVHITVDVPGRHLLAAHNDPSAVTQLALQPDGALGVRIAPAEPLDVGLYAHQVRADPSGRSVIVVARGFGATATQAARPGALVVLDYAGSLLRRRTTIVPPGAGGFNPRNLDYHPSRPFLFLAVEVQNELQVFRRSADGTPDAEPAFTRSTLGDGPPTGLDQRAGAILVHPSGRTVYVANRAVGAREVSGATVFAGGENSIAVFSIDERTGEPTLIQRAPTGGFEPRTFALDPSGRMMVVANQIPMMVREGDRTTRVSASLQLFRVSDDGRLTHARRYETDATRQQGLYWTGFATVR